MEVTLAQSIPTEPQSSLASPEAGIGRRGANGRPRPLWYRTLTADETWDWLSVLLMASVVVTMLLTLSDYGLTYDEEPHIKYGERVLAFYTEGFKSNKSLSRSSYGAGFDLVAALVRRVSPWDAYRTNHWLCVAVAQVGLLGTYRLGRLCSGAMGGFFSLALLALTPVYYGHQFNNPKDIPFAAGYVWALYFVARVLRHAASLGPAYRPPPARFWVGVTLALALAMSVRVGGLMVSVFLMFFIAVALLDRLRVGGPAPLHGAARLCIRVGASLVAAWSMMVAIWPRALLSPFEGPQRALAAVTHYKAYDSPTLLGGKVVASDALPWDYLPTYFALQLPEPVSVAAGCAALWVVAQASLALWGRRPLPLVSLLLLTATLSPPAYAIVRGSRLYNGLRHFLFLIPVLSVLAGGAVAGLARWTGRRLPVGALVVVLVAVLACADQALAMVRLHPYEHVYFNRWAGGPAAAVGKFETEYYGAVYQELLSKLNEHAWQHRRHVYLSRTFTLWGCGDKLFFGKNIPLNFAYVSRGKAPKADFFASYVRDRCLRRFRGFEVLERVEREGATLGLVRDLKARKPRRLRSAKGRAK